MAGHKVGNLVIAVSDPYPCWVKLRHEHFEDSLMTLRHEELSDLLYAVQWAMREAEGKLTEKERRQVRVL